MTFKLIATTIIACASALAQQNQLIPIPPTTSTTGSAVVQLVNSSTQFGEPAAIEWSMLFSMNVSAVSVALGNIPRQAGKTIACDAYAVGQPMICIIAGLNTNLIDSGQMARITLAYGPAGIGNRTQITFSNPVFAGAAGNLVFGGCYYTSVYAADGHAWWQTQ